MLERYLARRTDDDPTVRVKKVKRPKELGQRIAKLAAFFGNMPVGALNETTCEQFAAFVGKPIYARRCLGDFQAALNEYRRASLIRSPVQLTLPPAPKPREDWITGEEAVAIAKVCWRRRNLVPLKVNGIWIQVQGQQRPWRHIVKFMAVALATCSRSARVFEASYVPEVGRPFVDLDAGILHRSAVGEDVTNKRAGPVAINERLLRAMRRWSSDRVVAGKLIKGDRYVVEWLGEAADPKGAFFEAVAEARKQYPDLFLRRDGSPKRILRHTLRHSGITWLAMDPSLTVDQIVTYADITLAMFKRVYAHHHEAAHAAVVASQARKRTPKAKPKKPENA